MGYQAMSEPAKKKAAYADLFGIPDNTTGEIIGGELIVHRRPSKKHIYAASRLGNRLGPPYEFGEGGGPGGWIILLEPDGPNRLDTYRLESNQWLPQARFYENDKVRAEPFQEIEFDLGDLWLGLRRQKP
ncbi:MAG: hypothetical protein ACP5SH_13815 [Syntrophobacteraceae bacterium]